MLGIPRLIHLAQGSCEGRTPLNAFDNALREGGISDLNLLRTSSIVPRGAVFGDPPQLPVGALVPAVYASVTSNVPGEMISACVGAGCGERGGVLMEYQHAGPADAAERVVEKMIEEAFARRGWRLDDVRFTSAEHKVDRLGCAVAAALLLDIQQVQA